MVMFFFIMGLAIFFIGTATAVVTSLIFFIKKNKNLKQALIAIPTCLAIGFIMALTALTVDDKPDEEAIASTSVETSAEASKSTSSVEAETSTEQAEPEPEPEPEPEKPKDAFLAACYEHMDKEVADYAYDVLKNQIGFTKLEFKSAVSGTTNYEVYADDVLITVTASEGYCRVFIPNTKYVFYEDGAVKMSAAVFADRMIDSEQQSHYYIMAQEIVKSALKNPSSARFPSIITGEAQIGMQKNRDLVAVSGYVDAKNSFNAKVRSNWTVEFRVTDYNSFACDTVYINIDGEKYGEFIDLN